MNQVNKPSDDIDIIGFFQVIGRFFKSVGQFIAGIFIWLFERIIVSPYLLFRKYKIIFSALFVLMLATGIYLNYNKQSTYRAEILVTPFFDSGKELYTRIKYLNDLAYQKKYDKLGQILHLTPKEAQSLLEFNIKPNFNERITLKYFNEYVNFLDSLALENLTYQQFERSFLNQQFDYPQHVITVLASESGVFKKLNPFFENLFKKDTFFRQRKKEYLETQKILLAQQFKALHQIDSLRESVNFAIRNITANQTPSSGGIIIGSSKIDFPEEKYNLFQIKNDILKEIATLQQNINEKKVVLLLNSKFPESGEKFVPIRRNYPVLAVLLFAFLLIVLSNLRDFARFLNRYETKPNKTDL